MIILVRDLRASQTNYAALEVRKMTPSQRGCDFSVQADLFFSGESKC